jgi:hypothetical protein
MKNISEAKNRKKDAIKEPVKRGIKQKMAKNSDEGGVDKENKARNQHKI